MPKQQELGGRVQRVARRPGVRRLAGSELPQSGRVVRMLRNKWSSSANQRQH